MYEEVLSCQAQMKEKTQKQKIPRSEKWTEIKYICSDLHRDEITAERYQETSSHVLVFYLNDIIRKILNKASNES